VLGSLCVAESLVCLNARRFWTGSSNGGDWPLVACTADRLESGAKGSSSSLSAASGPVCFSVTMPYVSRHVLESKMQNGHRKRRPVIREGRDDQCLSIACQGSARCDRAQAHEECGLKWLQSGSTGSHCWPTCCMERAATSVIQQLQAVEPAVFTTGMPADFCQVFEAWMAVVMHASCLFCVSYRLQATGRQTTR
jgi:hypothetical protein